MVMMNDVKAVVREAGRPVGIGRGRARALIPTSEIVHSHHKVAYFMS
jgi:hypothetical protein